MSDKKKSEKMWQEKQEKQTEKSTENKRKRDASFVPPEEPTKNNNNSNKSEDGKEDLTELTNSLKVIKSIPTPPLFLLQIQEELAPSWFFVLDDFVLLQSKTKEFKKQKKTHERVNAEEYIAVASADKPSKKKSKIQSD